MQCICLLWAGENNHADFLNFEVVFTAFLLLDLMSLIFIISLGTHFCDSSHRTYPRCLFVCDTWRGFPFLFFFYCIPANGWKLGLLCCWNAAGSESAHHLQQGYLAMSGAAGGSQDLLLGFGVEEQGANVGARLFWGALGTSLPYLCCGISKAQKLLKNNFDTVTFSSYLVLCSWRESLCALKFRPC